MNIKKLDSNIGPYRSPDLGVLEINKMRTVEDMIEYTTAAIGTHDTTEVTFHRKPEPHLVISKLEYGAEVRRERHVYKDQYIVLGEDGDYYFSRNLNKVSPVFTEEEFKDLKEMLKEIHDDKQSKIESNNDAVMSLQIRSDLQENLSLPSIDFAEAAANVFNRASGRFTLRLDNYNHVLLRSRARRYSSKTTLTDEDNRDIILIWSSMLEAHMVTDEMQEKFDEVTKHDWQWFITSHRKGFLWKDTYEIINWFGGGNFVD